MTLFLLAEANHQCFTAWRNAINAGRLFSSYVPPSFWVLAC